MSYDFARLFEREIDYGYANLIDCATGKRIPDYPAIKLYDLNSGRPDVEVSFSDILSFHPVKDRLSSMYLWIQHPKINETGDKVLFVLRSRKDNNRRWSSDVHSDLFVLSLSSGSTEINPAFMWEKWSKGAHHPSWFDHKSIIMNCNSEEHGDLRFSRFTNFRIERELLAPERRGIGHPSVSFDKKFILTDDYPDRSRLQTLKIVSISENREIVLGRFYTPYKYRGPLSCDLHPRWSNDNS